MTRNASAASSVYPDISHRADSTERHNVSVRHWVRDDLDTRLLLTVLLCLGAAYFTVTNGSPQAPFLYFILPPILSCWWFGPVYGGVAVASGMMGGALYGMQQDLPVTMFAFSAAWYGLVCAIPMTIAYRMQRHVRNREALLAQLVGVDQRRDEFFANLSHEMRTPLNAIRGYCQMLTKHGVRDPSIIDKSTDVITRSVQHLDRLVEDMLDVSMLVKGQMRLQPEVVNPVPLLLDALAVVRFGAEAKQINLAYHLPSTPFCVRVDPMRCQQVLWNLLSNSLKFTPSGGRIDVWLLARAADGGDRRQGYGSRNGAGIRRARVRAFHAGEFVGDPRHQRVGARPVDREKPGRADGRNAGRGEPRPESRIDLYRTAADRRIARRPPARLTP